jgi:hypothetical protein
LFSLTRKLSETQQKYSVAKIELLAIVGTLNVFKGMQWGQCIKVFTNHKNLTRYALASIPIDYTDGGYS